ncbi:sulfatase [Bacillaceae bacterium SIJ1]|uniref:sulfatase family protein n=1 Tax=Litoribacterium kuwaitense TaxID=1398745 RepID=UPI0013ED2C1F|nr:sulfatase [Litoribacterium kuwaitense]NGP45440.1 sulfatase [Litoribacterium kuwaitense]
MNQQRPNIVFIMSDDHAAHAMSCYGSKINETPNIDRIANEGMRFDNCFCTNSICAPSRAAILTGKYNHECGVRTLDEPFDARQQSLPKIFQENGYQTAMIGKWHLGHGGISDPQGFDYWNVFVNQGFYHQPKMIEMGEEKVFQGYATDLVTDFSMDWLDNRDTDKPFLLFCHHKAPHRPWEPDEKHAHMYEDVHIPEPETFNDDYANRSEAAKAAKMRMSDLRPKDLKEDIPEGLTPEEENSWRYQRYIKDYLRCVASVDDNVGRLLDYLDEQGLTDSTIIVYTSDQGFFLGDHGWFDKRFMYEESLRMPFVIRYPQAIKAGSVSEDMILNVDFAPTFLTYAGIDVPADMQGVNFQTLLEGKTPDHWRDSMYYRYWMHCDHEHNVHSHYGIRTHTHKLIYYYGEAYGLAGSQDIPTAPEWELFDLENDPYEMKNVYGEPEYEETFQKLKAELEQLQRELGDEPVHSIAGA